MQCAIAGAAALIPPLATAAPAATTVVNIIRKEEKAQSGGVRLLLPSSLRRVALLLPLSGNAGSIGQSLLNSAQMALFDVAHSALVLQVYNTHGTPNGAAYAAEIALAQGVQLIIGPLFSSEVKAVGSKAQSSDVKVIAFTNDQAIMAVNGVFVLGHQVRQQVERVALFACGRGLTVFAALAPDDSYGQQAVTALRAAVTSADGRVTAVEFYDPDTADLTPAVRRLAHQQPFDAVLVPDRGDRIKQVAPLLPYFDINLQETRLLGTQRWTDERKPYDLSPYEPSVGWYAAPFSTAQTQFVAHYRQAFGGVRPLAIARLAYDAVALAAVLARGTTGSTYFDSSLISSDSGFAGVDGLFRLRPSGRAERELAVLEVRDDGLISIVSPPQDFFAP
ncbi:Extracellular ligand-binding receptor [invertebrate metagenome]|uniref:Extracellular ligand-binding receptor n=1 Tax=invertebrate metagenome TaxID=1711999 RepID=A0A484H6T3_9ZZZZ